MRIVSRPMSSVTLVWIGANPPTRVTEAHITAVKSPVMFPYLFKNEDIDNDPATSKPIGSIS